MACRSRARAADLAAASGAKAARAAGVLAGLAVASGMRRAGYVPQRDITVMAIRAEEAVAWFPFGCPGSRAATGTLPAEALAVQRMDTAIRWLTPCGQRASTRTRAGLLSCSGWQQRSRHGAECE